MSERLRNLFYEQLQAESDGELVSVIRCKDCKFYQYLGWVSPPAHLCVRAYEMQKASYTVPMEDGNGYCAWGEKR